MNIVLNGKKIGVDKLALSYGDIELMALVSEPTVTYRFKSGTSGTLTRGDKIVLTEGVVINAMRTGDA